MLPHQDSEACCSLNAAKIGAGGEEKPLVSGYEGLMTLKVMDAVKLAANSGELVRIER